MTTQNDVNDPNSPTWRKPIGMLLIILFILIWSGIAVTLIDAIDHLHFWILLPIYMFLGIAWIFPMKPMLLWMNTGKFRQKP